MRFFPAFFRRVVFISFHFVSFRSVSFRFISFLSVCFGNFHAKNGLNFVVSVFNCTYQRAAFLAKQLWQFRYRNTIHACVAPVFHNVLNRSLQIVRVYYLFNHFLRLLFFLPVFVLRGYPLCSAFLRKLKTTFRSALHRLLSPLTFHVSSFARLL